MVPLERDKLRGECGLINFRRDGRVVECGGLENRCSPSGEPGVRIPLSPQRQINPAACCGLFILQMSEPCLHERRQMKNKKALRVKRVRN